MAYLRTDVPTIVQRKVFGGAATRMARLGLAPVWREVLVALTGFKLRLRETRHEEVGKRVRHLIASRLQQMQGWHRKKSRSTHWTKKSGAAPLPALRRREFSAWFFA